MRRLTLGILMGLACLSPAWAARAPHLAQLKRLHADLIVDQRLDSAKLDRLRRAALEDDLEIDPAEASLLESFVAAGYDDPTGDPAPEIVPTFAGDRLKGWAARAQKLLVTALHASLGSTRLVVAFQELATLALSPDLTSRDREQTLTLLDNYRDVEPRLASREASTALALLLTDPEEARRDRAHRRQLERLEKLINRPIWIPPPATDPKISPAVAPPAP